MTGFISDAQRQAINQSLAAWRQGDISFDAGIESLHFADISIPHSPWSIREFQRLSSSNMPVPGGITPICHRVEGLVVLSQTCDVIRDCVDRPFVEIAPLVQLDARIVEETRLLKRPSFGFVPATENRCLVADLDRPLTIEKSIVARWNRVAGWNTDEEIRDFSLALSRKRSRFAFPDDFVMAARNMQRRFVSKHSKQTSEGIHLRALKEIRVRAAPSWTGEHVILNWWFIKGTEPDRADIAWADLAEEWLDLFDRTGRFGVDTHIVCRLEDMTARDYVESVPLDLDQLSVVR